MNILPKKPRFFNLNLFKTNKEKDQFDLIKDSLKKFLKENFKIDDKNIEEAIRIIDQAGKNEELYNLIELTIKKEFISNLNEIFKSNDFLLLYNFFRNFENIKFLCDDIFSIFEQNFLVFIEFDIEIFFNKIINEILIDKKNKIAEQLVDKIIKKYIDIYNNSENEEDLDEEYEKLNKFLEIINYLNIEEDIMEKYTSEHVIKEYNPKLEIIKKLDLQNFSIKFEDLKKKELFLIRKVFLKKFHDNLITNFYKVIYNINIERFLLLIHLNIKNKKILEIKKILQIFEKTKKIEKLMDLLATDYKKLIINSLSIENLIKTVNEQVKNCETFFENFKQVERKILYNISNTLNYEKHIDPLLIAKAFYYKLICNEKSLFFLKEDFMELIVVMKFLTKTDVIFDELYKIFLESFFLEDFDNNFFSLIEILENEFGKDKFKKFRDCFEEVINSDQKFRNLDKSVLDVKVLNKKIWPFKNKNEINFDFLPEPLKDLYLEKKKQFNSSNNLLELNFLSKFNICEIFYNNNGFDLIIKCDLIGAIIFFSFGKNKEICLKFISSKNMIPIEELINKVEEMNKKYKIFILCGNNLKIDFSKIEKNILILDFIHKRKNHFNLHDLKIESVELKYKPKEEILKQKKKVVKSIIVRTIKMKGNCKIDEVIKDLEKSLSIKGLIENDLNQFIEGLIDSDIIERHPQNVEILKYVD